MKVLFDDLSNASCGFLTAALTLAVLALGHVAADSVPIPLDQIAKTTWTYKTVGSLDIKLDVYRPEDNQLRPVVIWVHGGGLIMGSRTGVSRRVREPLLQAGYVLASIDYRLAPETKLPEILQDLEDAYTWVHENGPRRFGGNTDRLIVMGGSAGGYPYLYCRVFRAKPRPTALVSFWGYGDLTGAWYSRPSEFYRRQPMVARHDALQGVSGPPVVDGRADGRNGARFYLYCRQQGLWPLEVSGFDPDKESAAYDDFCPVRNVTADYPPTLMRSPDADAYDEASRLLSEAMPAAITRFGDAHPDTLGLQLASAQLRRRRGEHAEAAQQFDALRPGLENALGPNHRETRVALFEAGLAFEAIGQLPAAAARLGVATERCAAAGDAVLPEQLEYELVWLRVRSKLNQHLEIADRYRAAVERAAEVFAADSPRLQGARRSWATHLGHLAGALYGQERFGEAIDVLRRCHAAYRTLEDPRGIELSCARVGQGMRQERRRVRRCALAGAASVRRQVAAGRNLGTPSRVLPHEPANARPDGRGGAFAPRRFDTQGTSGHALLASRSFSRRDGAAVVRRTFRPNRHRWRRLRWLGRAVARRPDLLHDRHGHRARRCHADDRAGRDPEVRRLGLHQRARHAAQLAWQHVARDVVCR